MIHRQNKDYLLDFSKLGNNFSYFIFISSLSIPVFSSISVFSFLGLNIVTSQLSDSDLLRKINNCCTLGFVLVLELFSVSLSCVYLAVFLVCLSCLEESGIRRFISNFTLKSLQLFLPPICTVECKCN